MRESNIVAAKAVADAVRTSLGPRGMDKMVPPARLTLRGLRGEGVRSQPPQGHRRRDTAARRLSPLTTPLPSWPAAQISSPKGEVVITNDGATILKQMQVAHPTAKMLVDLSKSQDVEAGDGTTTVTVIAGSLLNQAQILLEKGIHPTVISESFLLAARKSEEILKVRPNAAMPLPPQPCPLPPQLRPHPPRLNTASPCSLWQSMSMPVDLADRDELIKAATTSLNSKVISNNSDILAPLAVDAILKVIDPATATNVDLNDIAVVKKLGGTIDETSLVDGLVFTQRARHSAGGPGKVANAKIGLIQFCLSAPKTDIEQNVVVSDYSQMDRILKEERQYILTMCKKIKASGCNVLLVQKSILRDAVNDLSLHFLAKMKVVRVRVRVRVRVELEPVAAPHWRT